MMQLIYINYNFIYCRNNLCIVTKNRNKNYNVACIIQNHGGYVNSGRKFTNNTSFFFIN